MDRKLGLFLVGFGFLVLIEVSYMLALRQYRVSGAEAARGPFAATLHQLAEPSGKRTLRAAQPLTSRLRQSTSMAATGAGR